LHLYIKDIVELSTKYQMARNKLSKDDDNKDKEDIYFFKSEDIDLKIKSRKYQRYMISSYSN